MKNSIKILATFVILAISGGAFAQISATATGTVESGVICPMTLVKVADLNFGCIAGDGTVTVYPDGSAATVTGNATIYHGSATHDEPVRAEFTVGGQGGYHFHVDPGVISWDNPNPFLLGGGVVTFTSNMSDDPVLPDGEGCVTMPMYVGGTWNIPAGATPGYYSANFNITVHYN